MRIAFLTLIAALLLGAGAAGAERVVTQAELAKSIGFVHGEEYRWTRFVEIKRAYDIGIAGHYEMIDCDGPRHSPDAWCAPAQRETWYYDNHDLTVTVDIRTDEQERTFARIVQIARGRVPELHERF